MTSIKDLTTKLSGAEQSIKAINARLGEGTKLGTPQTARKVTQLGQANGNGNGNDNDKDSFWDWIRGIIDWGGWNELVGVYKQLVELGLIKPPFDAPEKLTEAELRRIIGEILAAEEKPLWQKVLPYAGIATLGTVVIVLLLRKK